MKKWLGVGLLVLLANAAYIAAFPSPTVFYVANVLLHLGLGIALAAAFYWLLFKDPGLRSRLSVAASLLLIATALGVYLAITGATTENRWAVWAHVAFCCLGIAALIPYLWSAPQRYIRAFVVVAAIFAIVPATARFVRAKFPSRYNRVINPQIVATTMDEEGAGPNSPFFPSSSDTNTHKIIPSNFFMDSAQCGECHKDIYRQWEGSMHHFASFNNQFYRKSIEYMQDVVGTRPSKWCAGCHDHAVFFNGRFDRPIKYQVDTPEAQNGLGCMSCHSIVHVRSTLGNADFVMKYPPLHKLASSKNPILHGLDHYITYLNPEPHRETFMRPFMKGNSAEFCAACHKNHLGPPVNHYRYLKGFDDYDNWQASGISGEGARSFYYPKKPMVCADCHMPMVKSQDPGNINGFVHSHRFPAANTAVAYANHDAEQLKAEEKFLTSGFITTDIFAASPVDDNGRMEMKRRASEAPQIASTFAVGEEAEQQGNVFIRKVGEIAAPLNETSTRFTPGSTVRVDTVVRTRTIGHFFPGGTVDAFDVWLEMQGRDANGKIIYWSGMVEDNGKGPVEPGAHFYRSYLLDAQGNHINKRNAWAARTVLYIHLIPPGAADVAHFRIKIPKDAKGPITLTAKLNYRKFSYEYTQFAYAGEPLPDQPKLIAAGYDSRKWSYAETNIPHDVSGEIKDRVPNLPIVTLAEATAKLNLNDGTTATEWQPVIRKQDRERWNDWGIGLLLQGDLKGAEYAFQKVTQAEPGYADGWLNVARALIQEGETDSAKPYIAKAMQINSNLGRVWFFKAMIQKSDGDYDGALASLEKVHGLYPRDRVVCNQIGRLLFLKRNYAGAVKAVADVISIDPEDLQAHYTLMLAYRGLKEPAKAAREEKLFRRFKADEASQTITGEARLNSPENNNERQPIHDHESVPLP